MSTSDEQIWLAGRYSLANQGDPHAQMDLARAYWHGKIVPKDVKKSEALLRRAEKELGEEAWLEIVRILFWENDPRIRDVFYEKKDLPNGIACFIFGNYLQNNGEIQEAIQVYATGARRGHFGCKLRHHRLIHTGICFLFGIPRLLAIFADGIKIGLRDENDPRWRK